MSPSLSSTATSSVSVELLVLIFCFRDVLEIAPQPMVKMLPVCPRQSSWVWWDPSTYQWRLVRESARSMSFNTRVPFKYLSTRLSFPQSSSSGLLTRVVIKATATCMSRRARVLAKRSCATEWWKAIASCSGRGLASAGSLVLKRWSAAGDGAVPVISSGKSAITFEIYASIPMLTWPGVEKSSVIPR